MFLIKYATRGRPASFKKAVQNILDTIDTNDFRILVSCDTDDSTMERSDVENLLKPFQRQVIVAYGASASKVHAINRDIEMVPEWSILVNMSDDMEFVVRGWDAIIKKRTMEVWGESLDFFAHFNDGYAGEKLPTMSIMGRAYYDRFGYIYHPDYKSFSCDAEAMYVAQMLERHHYFPEVLFLHRHPSQSSTPFDETYQNNERAGAHDTEVYWRRLKRYFDVELTEGMPVPFRKYLPA